MIAGSILDKNALGIDINPKWKEIYQQVCEENNVTPKDYLVGDSSNILKKLDGRSFDFLLTDVPYFIMDKLPRTRGKFSRAGEISKDRLHSSLNRFNDLAVSSYRDWITLLSSVFETAFDLLQGGSWILVFIGNMYRNIKQEKEGKIVPVGQYLPLDQDVSGLLKEIGYRMYKELIWMDPAKKLGVYGYPYVWIPSMTDQRILVFRKPIST